MSRLLAALQSGRVLLMDGAMGTELLRLDLPAGETGARANLVHPERVRSIHHAYVTAGADVLLTNTFLVNDAEPGDRRELAAAGGRLARSAAGPDRFVLASLGPTYSADGTVELPVPRQYRFWDEGLAIDGRLLETFSSPRVRFLTRRGGPPILLSLTYERTVAGRLMTHSGHRPEWFARRARHWGVAALGVNCGRHITLDDCVEILRQYRDVTDLPLFARPNAGTPERVGERWVYPLTPEQMAEQVPRLLEAGAVMIGGCCGTTPAHIAALRAVVDPWNRARASATPGESDS